MTYNIRKSIRSCKNNRERTLAYIVKHGKVTPLLALSEWGETRLATYVHDLREEGFDIRGTSRISDAGKRYMEYALSTDQWDMIGGTTGEITPLYQRGPAPQYTRFPQTFLEV